MALKLEIEELEQRIAPSVTVDVLDADADKNHVNVNGDHVNANHLL